MEHPIITRIVRQQKRAGRVSIFLDGEFAFGAQDDVVYRFGLAKGVTMTPELRVQVESANAVLEGKRAAERLIARRLRGSGEIRLALRKKGYAQEVIDVVVEDFTRAGLLDDAEFAAAFVRDRMRFKPKSRTMLERELEARGVSPSIVRAVLGELLGGDAERVAAQALARKYLARRAQDTPDVLRRRAFSYLLRRGYSASLVSAVLQELITRSPDEYVEE